MSDVYKNCQLEWDRKRGVIYVHDKTRGITILRICGLKKIETTNTTLGQIDISNPSRVSFVLVNVKELRG